MGRIATLRSAYPWETALYGSTPEHIHIRSPLLSIILYCICIYIILHIILHIQFYNNVTMLYFNIILLTLYIGNSKPKTILNLTQNESIGVQLPWRISFSLEWCLTGRCLLSSEWTYVSTAVSCSSRKPPKGIPTQGGKHFKAKCHANQ